jgi:hypothetical protein
MAAGLAPMNEKASRLAVAVSASAVEQGNTTLADLTQLMLSARSQVLTEMIPGRQQIGAGCGHPGPSAEVMVGESLFAAWVLFWQKAFRVAPMKDVKQQVRLPIREGREGALRAVFSGFRGGR